MASINLDNKVGRNIGIALASMASVPRSLVTDWSATSKGASGIVSVRLNCYFQMTEQEFNDILTAAQEGN